MFNFIYIYNFIPMSGCVGMGPSALLCPGAYDAVKMALSRIHLKHRHQLCHSDNISAPC